MKLSLPCMYVFFAIQKSNIINQLKLFLCAGKNEEKANKTYSLSITNDVHTPRKKVKHVGYLQQSLTFAEVVKV